MLFENSIQLGDSSHSLPSPRRVKSNSKLGLFGYGNILMAAVGPTRQSRVSMSVSMSLVQGGAAGASAAGTVLGKINIFSDEFGLETLKSFIYS